MDKIALCTLKRDQYSSSYNMTNFPLSDILKDFYRDAELLEDFYSFENLKLLYTEYKKECENTSFTIDQLQQEGWILVMFGRWSSPLERLSVWENVKIDNEYEYEDAEIIQFLVWLKKQSRKNYNLKLCKPEDKLKKWAMLYPDLPSIEWFEQQNFLFAINDEYFAYRAYTYSQEVDKALAGLWLEWKNEKPSYWIKIARALKGTYSIFEYLPEDYRRDWCSVFYFAETITKMKNTMPWYKYSSITIKIPCGDFTSLKINDIIVIQS